MNSFDICNVIATGIVNHGAKMFKLTCFGLFHTRKPKNGKL